MSISRFLKGVVDATTGIAELTVDMIKEGYHISGKHYTECSPEELRQVIELIDNIESSGNSGGLMGFSDRIMRPILERRAAELESEIDHHSAQRKRRKSRV